MGAVSLVWLRLDLRLHDHAALCAAAAEGGAAAVFVLPPEGEQAWLGGAAARWWLHHSLSALSADIADRGGRLILRRGNAAEELVQVAGQCGADRVHCHRIVDPDEDFRLNRVRASLARAGMTLHVLEPNLLAAPGSLLNRAGEPFKVFTPFHRALLQRPVAAPVPAPARMADPGQGVRSLSLEELGLLPRHDWAGGLRENWRPGEKGAQRNMNLFLDGAVGGYPEGRDTPSIRGTSRLSPHLHFGEISARALLHETALRAEAAGGAGMVRGAEAWVRQLHWREFAQHLLWHMPRLANDPMRAEFSVFPWEEDGALLQAWRRGRTGYPMVDAGMRELWHTGWMHNRVRMIAASFLVKHLLQHWRTGAAWFAGTLVDADLANNMLGWQWTAGCGPDAAPYFRVFNPALQGKRFDPDGAYVRRWVPELARLEARHVHAPWEAPAEALRRAGVTLGGEYPRPVVEHAGARQRALLAYEQVRRARMETQVSE